MTKPVKGWEDCPVFVQPEELAKPAVNHPRMLVLPGPRVDIEGGYAPLAGTRVPDAGRGARKRRRKLRNWEIRQWQEQYRVALEHKKCIEQELAFSEQMLDVALRGPSADQAMVNGAPTGMLTGGGGALLLGSVKRNPSPLMWLGLAALVGGATYSSGLQRHQKVIDRLQGEVFRLKRELAAWTPPPRPPTSR